MEMRPLGRTGVSVSKFCFGAGMFGFFGNSDEAECKRMVDRAIDSGINYFDTSDVYSYGESESILGKALKGKRSEVILATKFSLPMDDNPNHRGNSRRWIIEEVENSLRRLDTDYIDLYQAHRPDASVDIDETLGALTDLISQGKIRMIGTSTFPAEQIVEAHWCSDRRGHARFHTEQPPYSLFARRIEADVLPTCQRHGMGVVVWSPLSQGWLTGKWRHGQKPNDTQRQNLQPHLYQMDRPENQRKLDLIDELDIIAKEADTTIMHLALAFVCAHPAITSAIIGPRTFEQLEGILDGAEVVLNDATLDAIDALIPPGTNISHDDDGYVAPEIDDASLRRRLTRSSQTDNTGEIMKNVEAYREQAADKD